MLNQHEIIETLNMIDNQHLDIRTITMGISLRNCAHPNPEICAQKMYDKITKYAENLVKTGEDLEREMGIPIINKRISVTPIAIAAESCETEDYTIFAKHSEPILYLHICYRSRCPHILQNNIHNAPRQKHSQYGNTPSDRTR